MDPRRINTMRATSARNNRHSLGPASAKGGNVTERVRYRRFVESVWLKACSIQNETDTVEVADLCDAFLEILYAKVEEEPKHALRMIFFDLANSSEYVTKQHLSLFLSLFGPPEKSVSKLLEVLSMPWFHGSKSREQAEETLLRSPKEGLFLVRYSTTRAGTFAVDYIRDGKVNHLVCWNEKNGDILVPVDKTDGTQKLSRYDSLPMMIEQNVNVFKVPCALTTKRKSIPTIRNSAKISTTQQPQQHQQQEVVAPVSPTREKQEEKENKTKEQGDKEENSKKNKKKNKKESKQEKKRKKKEEKAERKREKENKMKEKKKRLSLGSKITLRRSTISSSDENVIQRGAISCPPSREVMPTDSQFLKVSPIASPKSEKETERKKSISFSSDSDFEEKLAELDKMLNLEEDIESSSSPKMDYVDMNAAKALAKNSDAKKTKQTKSKKGRSSSFEDKKAKGENLEIPKRASKEKVTSRGGSQELIAKVEIKKSSREKVEAKAVLAKGSSKDKILEQEEEFEMDYVDINAAAATAKVIMEKEQEKEKEKEKEREKEEQAALMKSTPLFQLFVPSRRDQKEEIDDDKPTTWTSIPYNDLKIIKTFLLGRGISGTVHQAEWNGNIVAVKRLPAVAMEDFLQEAKAMSSIRSPYLVKLLGVCEAEKTLVTEFMDAGNLTSCLKAALEAKKYLSQPQMKSIALSVAKGIQDMHLENYIHRDLKPDNILLKKDGKKYIAKIADMGLARKMESQMTAEIGTFAYMAPELLCFSEDQTELRYDQSVDIFSFGFVLYELLYLDNPFCRMGPKAVHMIMEGQRPPIPTEPVYPEKIVQLIPRCWAQKPSDRPSATAVINILGQWKRKQQKPIVA